MLLRVALFEPEIPPNTGNVMRLCANTATELHLIHPLGFSLDDRRLRRAGMDYRDRAVVTEHPDFDSFLVATSPGRLFAFSRDGSRRYTEIDYRAGDMLLFGPESDGLPHELIGRSEVTASVCIPMVPESRSLNLSNAVAIAVFEANRQWGFPHLEPLA